jgi:hypothetical protein
MNNLKATVQSITYIITGELLQLSGSISDSWVSTIVIIFGIVLFFNGLSKLKMGLDAEGQSGAQWLIIASVVGFFASIVDFIPLMGVISSLLFTLCFIFHILGFVKLGKSKSIGSIGKSGITLLFVAMGLAIVANLISIIPFFGSMVGSVAGLGALMCALYGWLRIQEGIIEQRTVSV